MTFGCFTHSTRQVPSHLHSPRRRPCSSPPRRLLLPHTLCPATWTPPLAPQPSAPPPATAHPLPLPLGHTARPRRSSLRRRLSRLTALIRPQRCRSPPFLAGERPLWLPARCTSFCLPRVGDSAAPRFGPTAISAPRTVLRRQQGIEGVGVQAAATVRVCPKSPARGVTQGERDFFKTV